MNCYIFKLKKIISIFVYCGCSFGSFPPLCISFLMFAEMPIVHCDNVPAIEGKFLQKVNVCSVSIIVDQ